PLALTWNWTLATPLRESVALALRAGVLLLRAAPLGGPVTPTAGAVLSTLTVTEAEAVLPALSAAVPDTDWLAPSVVTVTGLGQLATPLVLSKQLKLIVTLLLFQCSAFGGGTR